MYGYNQPDLWGNKILTKQLLTVITVFILPISDTTTVFINRLLRGQSPFIGGRDHTTHNLSYIGLSDRNVALLFIVINLISIALALYIYTISSWSILYITLNISYIAIIFSSLFIVTRINEKNKK